MSNKSNIKAIRDMSKPTIWENIVRMSDHIDNEWPVEWRVSADAAIDRILLRNEKEREEAATYNHEITKERLNARIEEVTRHWSPRKLASVLASVERLHNSSEAMRESAPVRTNPQLVTLAPTPEAVVARCTCYGRDSCEENS